MISIQGLHERIRSGVIDQHSKVIELWLDNLDDAYQAAKKCGFKCSYAHYLGLYVRAKVSLHSIRKITERQSSYDLDNVRLENKIPYFMEEMISSHNHMYDSPCHECDVCKSRTRSWPMGKIRTRIKGARDEY